MMTKEEAQALIDKYLAGKCTAVEKRRVESWYNQQADRQTPPSDIADYERVQRLVYARLPVGNRLRSRKRAWGVAAAAAVALLVATAGLYLYRAMPARDMLVASGAPVLPGSNKAVLTLADGQTISVTDAEHGELVGHAGMRVVKQADGQLTYQLTGNHQRSSDTVSYHTLHVPNGGQYQIQLADGTKVWLNAASSLRYPSTFTGKERVVELSGEAYFEVAHLSSGPSEQGQRPFRVIAGGQEVRVLGTHFNVQAYPDEAVTKTTLVEGSVKVSTTAGHVSHMLAPGEAATLQDNKLTVGSADTAQATAWKNGYFLFRRLTIQAVMRQISRWYDVEVAYEGPVAQDEFVGKIPRKAPIEQVIRVLRLSNVNCRLEDKKLIITNTIH